MPQQPLACTHEGLRLRHPGSSKVLGVVRLEDLKVVAGMQMGGRAQQLLCVSGFTCSQHVSTDRRKELLSSWKGLDVAVRPLPLAPTCPASPSRPWQGAQMPETQLCRRRPGIGHHPWKPPPVEATIHGQQGHLGRTLAAARWPCAATTAVASAARYEAPETLAAAAAAPASASLHAAVAQEGGAVRGRIHHDPRSRGRESQPDRGRLHHELAERPHLSAASESLHLAARSLSWCCSWCRRTRAWWRRVSGSSNGSSIRAPAVLSRTRCGCVLGGAWSLG